jgi:hypothetical protein
VAILRADAVAVVVSARRRDDYRTPVVSVGVPVGTVSVAVIRAVVITRGPDSDVD